MRAKKSEMERAEKLTFRLAPRYAEKVMEAAKSAGVSPNQFGRIATMAVAQNGFLSLSERLVSIEEELIRLRRDFNEATEDY
jgi:uncharacterized protein (DUF1778 family)